jgi:tetrapyrrole methylase family protein/MazG family protein
MVKFNELVQLVETLREKCPWDKKQTLDSLKGKIIEEAYELVDAIEQDNVEGISEEIGDFLFLALFLIRLLEEQDRASLGGIIDSTIEKYKTKHPHVFAGKELKDEHDVLRFWHKSKKDIFVGIPTILPALLAAKVIQERTSKLGFDWSSYTGPLEKIKEEIRELEGSVTANQSEEMGDLLFSCVNLARHYGVDPEDALRHANKKFVRRFREILKELKKQGKEIDEVSLEEMDRIWDAVKREE